MIQKLAISRHNLEILKAIYSLKLNCELNETVPY